MRRSLLWIQLVLAALVVVGVWVQVYLIASYSFGAADALDKHQAVGNAVFGFEVLVFLAALGAWWRNWGRIGHAFALAAIGTIQISLSGADDWIGGVHGLLALVILTLAVFIAKDDVEALGLRRASAGDGASDVPPPPHL